MQGLDAWLEAPYQAAAIEGDHYVEWCEERGLDPEEDHWDEMREDDADRQADYDESRAEARAERDEDW